MTNKERTIFYQNCHNSTANIMQIISDSLWQKDPLTMQNYGIEADFEELLAKTVENEIRKLLKQTAQDNTNMLKFEKIQEFFEAKENVLWSLKHLDSVSVRVGGLEYWAGEVVRLHKIIKTNLNQ